MTSTYEDRLALLQSELPSARLKAARALSRELARETRAREAAAVGRVLAKALRGEVEESVQVALLNALAEAGYKGASSVASVFVDSPHARVRLAAARALASCAGRTRSCVPALLTLSRDRTPRIRDWACAGLQMCIRIYGHRDLDILEALAARLDDADGEVVGEAVLGLASAHDERGEQALRREIESGRLDLYMVLSARELGHEDLSERLSRELGLAER